MLIKEKKTKPTDDDGNQDILEINGREM